MEHGQTGEGEVPQHLFYSASIEEIDNATAYQYDMHGGNASAGSQDYHLMAHESVLPSSMSGKKQTAVKRVSHRGSAFTKEEDCVLCSAFLNIDDAVKMFEKTVPFHFMHCWKMLRNEAKWNDKLLEVSSSPTVAKVATTAVSNPQNGKDNAPVERPEDRDSAKRQRSREDTASSTVSVEVLQQIHDRNKNAEGKQDQQMQEILNMKGDKIQLTQKMFDLQKHDMEIRSKLKEEQLSINKQQLSLTKQDIEVGAKQSEAQLLTAEVGIMGADLEKLSPAVRSYYIMIQRQILERRGVITPENNDGP